MPMEGRYIETGAARTYVREVGEGEATLVLVHGAEAEGSMWEPYMEGLAGGRRVLAVDLPGHGGTEAPEDLDASASGIAEWFLGLLVAEGLDSVDLLGHSMGGTVALHIALERPELVRRLVLVDTGGLCWPAGPIGKGVDRFLRILVEGDMDEERVRGMVAQIYGWEPDGEAVRESARFWSQPGVRHFFARGWTGLLQADTGVGSQGARPSDIPDMGGAGPVVPAVDGQGGDDVHSRIQAPGHQGGDPFPLRGGSRYLLLGGGFLPIGLEPRRPERGRAWVFRGLS